MNIFDIHTHTDREDAIINCTPSGFSPQKGRYYSVGMHPWMVSSNYQIDWQLLQEIAVNQQVLAIGEAGMDKQISANIALQQHVFELQAELCERLEKPLIIHSVRASNELIRLKRRLRPSMSWVIHGFRNNKNVALQLLEEGFYLSFGEKYQKEALLVTPLERMFVETDESLMDIRSIYRHIAADLELKDEKLMQQIHENIGKVFFKR